MLSKLNVFLLINQFKYHYNMLKVFNINRMNTEFRLFCSKHQMSVDLFTSRAQITPRWDFQLNIIVL